MYCAKSVLSRIGTYMSPSMYKILNLGGLDETHLEN